jgi:dipeptidyl aminopeptidase/acylaminoacyl peptidase
MLFGDHAFAEKQMEFAFTRNHNLWMKIGEKEKQLTFEGEVTDPKWSHDGRWIAYAKGDQLWVYDTLNKKHFQFFHSNANQYQWAPKQSILAFKSSGVLNKIDLGKPNSTFKNVSLGVGSYSWLPDGTGFLASSVANLIPSGWTGVELFTIPIDANLDDKKIRHFYTLPKMSKDFFAIYTSVFKWSHDGKWIAFLGIPTASWSTDTDYLCLIRADGSEFLQVDKMLRHENWFHWAPTKNTLGYIEGEGRFEIENKHLKTKDLPVITNNILTPKGFVDWEFTWHSNDLITVSRAKEKKMGIGPMKRTLPVLYQVTVKDHHQKKITTPPKGYGDYQPVYFSNIQKLTWIRSNQKSLNMWIANPDGSNSKIWIKDIDATATLHYR